MQIAPRRGLDDVARERVEPQREIARDQAGLVPGNLIGTDTHRVIDRARALGRLRRHILDVQPVEIGAADRRLQIGNRRRPMARRTGRRCQQGRGQNRAASPCAPQAHTHEGITAAPCAASATRQTCPPWRRFPQQCGPTDERGEAARRVCGRVAIAGGLGFIGSNLARRLGDLGAEVLVVGALLPDLGGNRHNLDGARGRIAVEIADLRASDTIPFVEGREYLFNLAGQTSHQGSMESPFDDLDLNCRVALRLLEACRKVAPEIFVVFASTRQVYGKPRYLPVDEQHPLAPVDVNGIHKLAAEAYHTLYREVYGIKSSVLRLTNTYGPRMRIKDARQTFLGAWLRAVLEERPFE